MNKLTMNHFKPIAVIAMVFSSALSLAHDAPGSDYSTAVKADYVFGCMKANGETRQALESCSCSIDYIAERMPYDDYVTVETIMQASLDNGQRGSMYRELKWANDVLDKFKKLQLKSNVECFK